jgi:small subunit ribosomal protein S13
MARISGVDLPRNKRVEIALTYIFGIGRKLARDITAAAKIESSVRTDNLTEEQVAKLRWGVLEAAFRLAGSGRKCDPILGQRRL